MKNCSTKSLLVGIGAVFAFAQFGPLGIIILGIGLMLFDGS